MFTNELVEFENNKFKFKKKLKKTPIQLEEFTENSMIEQRKKTERCQCVIGRSWKHGDLD